MRRSLCGSDSSRWAIAVGFILVLGACAKPIRLKLRDTEGRAFEIVCANPTHCDVQSQLQAKPTPAKPEGARPGFVLHPASRLYAICDTWMQGKESFSINVADCRAIQCGSDAECPFAQGLTHGTCVNQLCIEPSGAISAEDAVLLCLAGTGPPAGTTKQIERFALANNCGSPCRVPAVCRQP